MAEALETGSQRKPYGVRNSADCSGIPGLLSVHVEGEEPAPSVGCRSFTLSSFLYSVQNCCMSILGSVQRVETC